MKTLTNKVAFFAGSHASSVRVVFFVLTIALFILTAGAAEASGTVGC